MSKKSFPQVQLALSFGFMLFQLAMSIGTTCRAFAEAQAQAQDSVPKEQSAEPIDYSLQLGFRSDPRGGGLSAGVGSKFLLWGERSTETDFKYGFVRLSMDVSTAITYNSIGSAIEFYPISFIALKLGQENNHNSQVYKTFDCNEVDCLGGRRKSFSEVRLAGKIQELFMVFRQRREWHEREKSDASALAAGFAEPASSQVLSASGRDVLSSYGFVIGHSIDLWPEYPSSVLAGYAEFKSQESGERTGQDFFGFSQRRGDYNFFGGIGYWRTSSRPSRGNFLVQVSWSPKRNWVPF